MPLPTHSNLQRSAGSGLRAGTGTGPFRDPSNFNDVFLGAFRRDLQSFYPGSRIEREPAVGLAGTSSPTAPALPCWLSIFSLTRIPGIAVNPCEWHSSESGIA